MPRRLAAIVLATACCAAHAAGVEDAVTTLARTIADRLVVVEQVARYKWNAHLAVLDETRESALRERTLDQAREIGIPPARARAIVDAQLAASRALQAASFRRWQQEAKAPFSTVLDLATELRPELDRLTYALLVAARDAEPALGTCGARAALTSPLFPDEQAWLLAISPFVRESCT
jgi:chorismate mutase